MSEVQALVLAEHLLQRFPSIYEALESAREDELNRGRQGSYIQSDGGYGHSDPTLDRVVKLDELAQTARLMKTTRLWIDVKLQPADRSLLINTWRGKNLAQMARSTREVDVLRWRWNMMVKGLAQFVNLYAGIALGQTGGHCAIIPERLFRA